MTKLLDDLEEVVRLLRFLPEGKDLAVSSAYISAQRFQIAAGNFIIAHAAEIKQNARDAERYRWLLAAANRDWMVGKDSSTGGCYQYYGDEISQAIDAAMQETGR